MSGSRWIAPLAFLLWSGVAGTTRADERYPVPVVPGDVPRAVPPGPVAVPMFPTAPAVEPVDPPVPTLTLRMRVPASAGPDDELQYRILIDNVSRASAHHVLVRNPLPSNARFVRATPEPNEKEPELRWQFGTLEPGTRKEIVLVLKPTGSGEVRNCARVQFEHGQCVTTRIGNTSTPTPAPMPRVQPEGKANLRLRIAGPAQAVVELGPIIDFETELTNAGTAPAKGVVLTNKLPAELAFSNSEPSVTGDQAGVVTWNLGDLAPGQTRRVRCTVIPKAVGRFSFRAEARDAAGVTGEGSRNITVGEPKLSLTTAGPKVRLVNRPATYHITVSNPGTMPVANVVVTTEITAGMTLQSATGDARIGTRRTRLDERLDREVSYQELRWSVGTLAPGDRRVLQMVLLTANEGTLDHRVTATADRNLEQHAEVRTVFEKQTGMHLEIIKGADPLSVGEATTYTLHALNQGDGAAQNVAVTLVVPEEMEILRDKLQPAARAEGQTVTFTVPTLAARATGKFVVPVRALKAGDVRLSAKLLCDQLKQGGPVTSEEAATIVAEGPGK